MNDKKVLVDKLFVSALSSADVALATFISRYYDAYNGNNIEEKIRILSMIANGKTPGIDFSDEELNAILDNYPPNIAKKEKGKERGKKSFGEWD